MGTDEKLVAAIERLVVESIGVTAVALSRAVPRLELSFVQWRALVVVGGAEDGIRVGEIARRIGSTVPATSKLVRRLEERGLAIAVRDETDRRATIVRLTPAGDMVRGALMDRRRQMIGDALASVDLSENLTDGLAQIAEALRRYA